MTKEAKEIQLARETGDPLWAALYIAAEKLNVPAIDELIQAQPTAADDPALLDVRYLVAEPKQYCGHRQCMLGSGSCKVNKFECPPGVCCGECPPCMFAPRTIWTATLLETTTALDGTTTTSVTATINDSTTTLPQSLREMIKVARAAASADGNGATTADSKNEVRLSPLPNLHPDGGVAPYDASVLPPIGAVKN